MPNHISMGTLLLNEPMNKHTSWRVGGPAERMYLPKDKKDLVSFIKGLSNDEPLTWIGLGSNLLVKDGGIRGTVINTRNRLKEIRLMGDNRVYVEVGVPCPHIARFCTESGLIGAEFLAGIPGTMGGALKMNAGAFGGETWTIVDKVETVNQKGEVKAREKSEFEVFYRSVKGLKDEWFISCELNLTKGDTQASQLQIKKLLEKRNTTQPTNKPTCGSVFKNPEGDYAARLIEDCGLKGYGIGGAVVSKKHANFIENLGHATAKDIENLITHVQEVVFSKFGIELQTEVCRIGEDK